MYEEELMNLHRGQGLELLWRDSLQCPTEEEYIEMVNNSECNWSILCRYKYYFQHHRNGRRLSTRRQTYDGMCNEQYQYVRAASNVHGRRKYSNERFHKPITDHACPYSDFVPLVNLIGVYFQIRDDYCNLQSTEVRIFLYNVTSQG